jgi:membrane-associated phospholipid phosphatase
VGRFARDFGDSTVWMAEAPFKMGGRNFAVKFVPIAAATTALTYGDPAAARYAGARPELNTWCNGISQLGAFYTLAGMTGTAMIAGKLKGNETTVQIGRGATVALLDAGVATYAMKFAFGRERPYQNVEGPFWKAQRSFPSGHAMMSFAVATAVARHPKCPRWLGITSYAVATAVSVARWGAFKHFPADIVAGGAMGYFIGDHAAHMRP